jgi:hypothetical protein
MWDWYSRPNSGRITKWTQPPPMSKKMAANGENIPDITFVAIERGSICQGKKPSRNKS